jgi:hypothetical protein
LRRCHVLLHLRDHRRDFLKFRLNRLRRYRNFYRDRSRLLHRQHFHRVHLLSNDFHRRRHILGGLSWHLRFLRCGLCDFQMHNGFGGLVRCENHARGVHAILDFLLHRTG